MGKKQYYTPREEMPQERERILLDRSLKDRVGLVLAKAFV